jgi:hypothetical protein
MKTEVFTLPAHWACALVNGDFSGLEDSEANELEAWQSAASAEGYGFCVDVSQESFFCKQHDASGYVLACDCLEFTFEVTQ